ncbi:MAG TPA: hypothetical protein VLQ80_19785, partial [Candidatus Saccharimonadia bacterium]|nr:hypothetical protein [Candidatus Saccharimonadia bacterium]
HLAGHRVAAAGHGQRVRTHAVDPQEQASLHPDAGAWGVGASSLDAVAAAAALDTAIDMLDPQPALGEHLIRRLLLQRQCLAAWFFGRHEDST